MNSNVKSNNDWFLTLFRNASEQQNPSNHEKLTPFKIRTKRKHPPSSISPDSISEQSCSGSIHSCPDIEYSLSDRPEADQYLYDVSTTTVVKNGLEENKSDNFGDDSEKYFLSHNAPRSSSEELSLSLDFSDDTLFDDKCERKDSESFSSELKGTNEESDESKLHKPNNQNSNSHRKGSVTFCDQSNQIVILNKENYSKSKATISNRKIGIYGKARHSPNLLHNPYGPPLYHHSRSITTTSDKVKSLTQLKTRKRDQNVITTKTKPSSVVESSYIETNGSGVQSHPVSKMNVPIKTYQKDYKNEIYQQGRMTEDQNKLDKKKEVVGLSRLFSSKYLKENVRENTLPKFEMKIDEGVDKRWRSRERKSIILRSRDNNSLNRYINLKHDDTSKKSFVHSNRSHSTPRKESQIKRESRQSNQSYSNKCSNDATR